MTKNKLPPSIWGMTLRWGFPTIFLAYLVGVLTGVLPSGCEEYNDVHQLEGDTLSVDTRHIDSYCYGRYVVIVNTFGINDHDTLFFGEGHNETCYTFTAPKTVVSMRALNKLHMDIRLSVGNVVGEGYGGMSIYVIKNEP